MPTNAGWGKRERLWIVVVQSLTALLVAALPYLLTRCAE